MKKRLIISLIILQVLAKIALAGDSVSISVSCTIPVMPGINAPFIEEETIRPQVENTAAEQKIEPQEKIPEQDIAMIEEDGQGEKIKTFYSR